MMSINHNLNINMIKIFKHPIFSVLILLTIQYQRRFSIGYNDFRVRRFYQIPGDFDRFIFNHTITSVMSIIV